MNDLIGLLINAVLWGSFLFIWLPIQFSRHRIKMSQLSAIRKGTVMQRRYKALKKLTRAE